MENHELLRESLRSRHSPVRRRLFMLLVFGLFFILWLIPDEATLDLLERGLFYWLDLGVELANPPHLGELEIGLLWGPRPGF